MRSYKYDPYGNVVTNTGSGPVDYLRYTGAYNASGGYFHNGARYYDPAAGNWTQQDPLNQTTSLTQANRYAYVGDSPVNLIDPAGTSVLGDVVGGAAEVVGGSLAAGGAALAQGACMAGTDLVGTAHCAMVTYPAAVLGVGTAADGVRRIYRGASR